MIPFTRRADQFPPVLVRLLARGRPHGPPLTDEEISHASGLSLHQVFILSQSTHWAGVDLFTMRQFLVACHVDFENAKDMERVDAYVRCRPTWQYLRKSPHWLTFYQPLLLRYRESILNTSNER